MAVAVAAAIERSVRPALGRHQPFRQQITIHGQLTAASRPGQSREVPPGIGRRLGPRLIYLAALTKGGQWCGC